MKRLEGDHFAPYDILVRQLLRLQRCVRGRLPSWRLDGSVTADVVQESLQVYLRQAVLHQIRAGVLQASRRPPEREAEETAARDPEEAAPLEAMIGVAATKRYLVALGRMSPEDREAIVARLELGYNYEQIALILGKPSPNAARVTVVHGLGQLAMEMDREA
jgi:RNA polymerase sigma-70 factor (ECF subfamily)